MALRSSNGSLIAGLGEQVTTADHYGLLEGCDRNPASTACLSKEPHGKPGVFPQHRLWNVHLSCQILPRCYRNHNLLRGTRHPSSSGIHASGRTQSFHCAAWLAVEAVTSSSSSRSQACSPPFPHLLPLLLLLVLLPVNFSATTMRLHRYEHRHGD